MKVSFDVDGTLSEDEGVQTLATTLNRAGGFKFFWERGSPFLKPLVLTSRSEEKWGNDLEFKRFLDYFGFSMADVVFTDHKPKSEFVDELGIDLHFDSDPIEVDAINRNCKCRAVLVGFKIKECNNLKKKPEFLRALF